jgi:superfamily II DNA or RNA helicase
MTPPSPTPSLAARCDGQFPRRDAARGEQYFRAGAVLSTKELGSVFEARVRGSESRPYRVAVRWKPTGTALEVSCTCPRFADAAICKHLWAAILAFDRDGLAARVPGVGPLHVAPDPDAWEPELDHRGFPIERLPVNRDEDDDEDWDDDDEHEDEELDDEDDEGEDENQERDDPAGAGAHTPTAGGEPHARWRGTPENPLPPRNAPIWRLRLDAVSDRLVPRPEIYPFPRGTQLPEEVWYVILLHDSHTWGGLRIGLWQRRRKRDGSLTVPQPLNVSLGMARRLPDREDRDILDVILALSHGGGWDSYSSHRATDRVTVPPAFYATLVPKMAATGRLCAWNRFTAPHQRPSLEPRLAWDPEPWTLRLRLERTRDGGLTIGPELARGEETRALGDPLLLLTEGLVVFEDTLAPFDPAGGGAWVGSLARGGRPIEVPAAEVEDALAQLWSMPALPPVVGPDDLVPRREQGVPVPRLRIVPRRPQHPKSHLGADLAYLYGDWAIEPDSAQRHGYDREGRRILLRDGDAEDRAARRLDELGVRRLGGPRDPERSLRADRMVAVAERLLDEGWQVEAEGRLLRTGATLRFGVSSGIEWLGVGARADFGDAEAALPEILAALRRRDRFVRLSDGSRGLLPREWLDRLQRLSRLSGGEEGEVFQFLPSQALLVDALLSDLLALARPDGAPEIDVDAAFAKLRERLLRPTRARPLAEPRGFQGTLRPYQRAGLGWLESLAAEGLGGCLADDMGLGKTVQVLALLQRRRLRPVPAEQKRPSLVIAPRSVVYNWLEEAARFAPRMRVADFTGAERGAVLPDLDRLDLVVTTYGVARRDAKRLAQQRFDYLVLDEAQFVKNPLTHTARAVRLLQAEHRLALTGTPVENHLGELWSLLDFLNPGLLGRLGAGLLSAGSGPEPITDEELAAVARAVRPFLLRRRKEEVLADLPPKTEQTLWCELGPRQRRIYEELRVHYRRKVAERIAEVGVARANMLVLEALLRLRQVACHPGLIDPGLVDRAQPVDESAKLDLLMEQLAELVDEGHKALLFSQFTSLLALVRRRLDAAGIVWEQLDGRTRNRKAKVERFQQDPDCPVFLVSLKAGGTGLNLTAAHYVFLLDPWWNPAVEAQAIDRTHRIGQRRPVFAYRLIARGTVEEKILLLQQQKRRIADAILGADAAPLRGLTAAEVDRLLS